MGKVLLAGRDLFRIVGDEPVSGIVVQLLAHNATNEAAQLPTGEASCATSNCKWANIVMCYRIFGHGIKLVWVLKFQW